MTEEEFIRVLRKNGFTAGEVLTIISDYVTDIQKVKLETLINVIPVFRKVMDQYYKLLNEYLEKEL